MNDHFTLPASGRSVPLSSVEYDSATNRFYYGPLDVTPYLTIQQKIFVAPEYDREAGNEEAYVEHYREEHGGATPPPTGSTSVWENFVENVEDNPLGGLGGGPDGIGGLKSLGKWVTTTAGLIVLGLLLVFLIQSGALKGAKK